MENCRWNIRRSSLSVVKTHLWGILFFSSLFLGQTTMAGNVVNNKDYLNITGAGTVCYWNAADPILGKNIKTVNAFSSGNESANNLGVRWENARDVQRFEVVCSSSIAQNMLSSMKIEYWHSSWPDDIPEMPSYEDNDDDLWRGEWITAKTNVEKKGNKIIFTFQPLSKEEVANAANLPGQVCYRRTMKMRVDFPEQFKNQIKQIDVFSMATVTENDIRIEFVNGQKKFDKLSGKISVLNGYFGKLGGWKWGKGDSKTGENSWSISSPVNKGITLKVYTAKELLPGSNEETVVTVKSSAGTFSFAPIDLLNGPMYIPDFNVYITKSDDPVTFRNAKVVKGKNIREQIKDEPEQSYERASKEIPHKDPLENQFRGAIYLPLACDASWQKFAVEWGGNIIMDRVRAKTQGKKCFCKWNGDELDWRFGTGEKPAYKRNETNCRISILNDYLPVVNSDWNHEGLLYKEEAFVTSSENTPLSPFDKGRNEYTPDVLMVKIDISNPSLNAKKAHFWLQGNQALTDISIDNGYIFDQTADGKYLRCYTKNTIGDSLKPELFKNKDDQGLHYTFNLGAGSSETFYFCFPFIGNLTSTDAKILSNPDYSKERSRVVDYWNDIVAKNIVFNVPEKVFDEMSKAVIPHIRMSVTKDPESGLYMVPAASYTYEVFANEAIFQTELLDRMGDFKTVGDYLDTFMKLQGSRKLPGAYTGDQKGVFYGVRISDDNDLTSVGYNMNHGTTLWGLAYHYMHSKDKEWLEKAAPHMIMAADWIIEQRNQNKVNDDNGNPVLHYGLLPAGQLEDCQEWKYWYATNAYAYLCIETMAEAFESAGLPKADYYKKEAEAYRNDILNSLQRAMELCPVVRLRNNTYVPYVPVQPYQGFRYFGPKKSKYYDRYGKGIYPI